MFIRYLVVADNGNAVKFLLKASTSCVKTFFSECRVAFVTKNL